MTNPFVIIVLRAIDSYNKVMTESPSQHTLSKGLFMFSLGTAIFATVMYKVTKTTHTTHTTPTTPTTPTTWSNFLSRFFNQYIVQSSKASDDTSFEDKYFKEYDEWIVAQDAAATHNKECLENMLYVRETINEFYGDIIMYYDTSISSFVYYARTANIPYKYLETVSRKYMIETNAPRDIYIDIRKEYAKAKDNLTNKKVSSNHTTSTDNNSDHARETEATDVFAKFKTYNTGSNLSNQKTATATNTKIPSDTDKPNTSTKIMRENANRYSYRGKIEDYNTPLPQNNTTDTHTAAAAAAAAATPANETYAEYKKRMNLPDKISP